MDGNNRYAGMYPQLGQQQNLPDAYKQQLDAAMALQHKINTPSGGGGQQQNHARIKTKMCAYANGNCPYAARGKCFFAHSLEELRQAGGGGGGGGMLAQRQQQRAPADPSKRKTKMCTYFLAGHCPYAASNSCTFAHSEEERQAALSQQSFQQPGAFAGQQQQYAMAQPADYAAYYNQIMLQHQQYAAAMAAQQQPASMQQYQQMQTANAYQQHQNYVAAYQQQWMAAQMMQQQQQQQQQVRSAPSPVYFKTRLCKFGDECPYQKNGKCRFAHSAAELRTLNVAAGEPPVPGTTAPALHQSVHSLIQTPESSVAAVPASQERVHPLLQTATMPVAAASQEGVHPLLQTYTQNVSSNAVADASRQETAQTNSSPQAGSEEPHPESSLEATEGCAKPAREREEAGSDGEDSQEQPAQKSRPSLFVEAIVRCARSAVLGFLSMEDADSFLEILQEIHSSLSRCSRLRSSSKEKRKASPRPPSFSSMSSAESKLGAEGPSTVIQGYVVSYGRQLGTVDPRAAAIILISGFKQ